MKTPLQANIGILPPWSGDYLVVQYLEGLADVLSRIVGHDDIVHITSFRRLIGMFVLRLVFLDPLFCCLLVIICRFYLPGEYDTCRGISTYNIYLGCRPGKDKIRPYALVKHGIMGTCVRLPDDDGDERYGGICPCKEGLCPMA